jgi:quinol-cytochrome oxidoreductase complex cytochrome b subunit
MPEWYFVSMYQLLKFVPATILGIEGEQLSIIFFSALAGLWIAIPLIDRKSARGVANTGLKAMGIAGVVIMTGLTLYAYFLG